MSESQEGQKRKRGRPRKEQPAGQEPKRSIAFGPMFDPETGLTEGETRFLSEFMRLGNITQAAAAAGYSPASAGAIGREILARPRVQEIIKQYRHLAAERTQLTAEEVVEDLRELRDMCMGRKPVKKTRIRDGEPVEMDFYVFDPMGAARALEKLGDYLQLWKQVGTGGDRHVTINIGTESRRYEGATPIDMGDAVVISGDAETAQLLIGTDYTGEA